MSQMNEKRMVINGSTVIGPTEIERQENLGCASCLAAAPIG
jgi:hypothetical protein